MGTTEPTAVILCHMGEEHSAKRVGGRHQTHWECCCGHLFGPTKVGDRCMSCDAEVIRVEYADTP